MDYRIMSYSCHFVHKKDKSSIFINNTLYQNSTITNFTQNSVIDASFGMTYNYYDYLSECFGKKSLRSLYHKPIYKVLDRINKAINHLIKTYYPDRKYWDTTTKRNYNPKSKNFDYWKSCPCNVIHQLNYIRNMILQILDKKENEDCILIGD